MARTIIAGNWKMYRTRPEALALVNGILAGAGPVPADRELLVFPAATAIAAVAERCRYSRISVGAQNLHDRAEGAFTGEISAAMVVEAGATHVLVGHSERRAIFGEDDAFLARKVRTALVAGLEPVFCLGETLAQREAGQTEAVIVSQVRQGLGELSKADIGKLVVAYEPVWAIGTGRTATPDQADAAHRFLRGQLVERWGTAGSVVPLLYGGSVKPGNAAELLARPEINGVLVGGASLEVASFLGIATAK
jgi:triosephosphate isomerase